MYKVWFAVLALAFAALLWVGAGLTTRLRVREQLLRDDDDRNASRSPEALAASGQVPMSWLRNWLFIAGFRAPAAPFVFAVSAAVSAAFAVVAAVVVSVSGVLDAARAGLLGMPGALGEILLPVVWLASGIVFVIIASIPWLHVRSVRQRRVSEIDQDLPVTLELLATLGESGMGFDASVGRMLSSQDSGRPLMEELRVYRSETLAGIPRLRCLRRLADRIKIPAVTIVVSALVQAEQLGAGTADVIRTQADDLRRMRRERAMAQAQSLPVKLVFPLVICFLPAIFLAALGPAFAKFISYVDNLTR